MSFIVSKLSQSTSISSMSSRVDIWSLGINGKLFDYGVCFRSRNWKKNVPADRFFPSFTQQIVFPKYSTYGNGSDNGLFSYPIILVWHTILYRIAKDCSSSLFVSLSILFSLSLSFFVSVNIHSYTNSICFCSTMKMYTHFSYLSGNRKTTKEKILDPIKWWKFLIVEFFSVRIWRRSKCLH